MDIIVVVAFIGVVVNVPVAIGTGVLLSSSCHLFRRPVPARWATKKMGNDV